MAKKDTYKRDMILCAVGVFFEFFFGRILGPVGTINQVGANILGVFIGVIIMTVFTGQTFFASVSGIIAMITGGYMTADAAISGWLGGTSVAAVIFIGSLSIALQKSGLMDVLVKKFVSAKALQHKPKLFLYALFMIGYFSSMFIGFVPAFILLMSVFEKIRDMLGYDPKSDTARFLTVGLYLSCMGSYALPFKGVTLVINNMANNAMKEYGLAMSQLTYWLTVVIVYVIFFLVYVFLLAPVFKCDLKPLKELDVTKVETIQRIPDKFDKRQTIIFIGFVVGVIYLIACNALPTTVPHYKEITQIGGYLGFLLILAILGAIRVDGKPVLNPSQCMTEGSMWGIVVIVGCFTYLGNAMASADLGIRAAIIKLLTPIFGGMGLIPLTFICIVVVVVATNFCNGLPLVLAAYAGVLPFVCQLAQTEGISASVIATVVNMSANMAFLTYASTITASLLLGRPEIEQKWIWSKGVRVVPVFIVVLFCVSMVLCRVLP